MSTHTHRKYRPVVYIHKLQESGFSEKIALIEAEALENITEEMNEHFLLMRADTANTNLRIEQVRMDLSQDIEQVHTDFTLAIEKLRAETKREHVDLRLEISKSANKILLWTFGMLAGGFIGILTIMAKGFQWI